MWVPNVEEDTVFARAAHATALGLKAGVAIPVLAADEAKQLVSHLLGDMATAPGLREYIVDRSGGNPLFVQGLVAMLREERLLRVDEPTAPVTVTGVSRSVDPEDLAGTCARDRAAGPAPR